MQYVLLFRLDEKRWADLPPADTARLWAECDAFAQDMARTNVGRCGGALQPTTTATTVRERAGQTVFSDGPFAETKEALAGYQIVECPTVNDAIALAKRFPPLQLEGTSVEIRPLMTEADEKKRWGEEGRSPG
ncbi:MAG: hypothetical protein JNG83_09145 [Opitutaceae bacterium]|nr:hypothetical protein [Opitutaceae bacterium]